MSVAPRLSICIATFKRGAFIVETLDSIVSQLSDDVELLVVDGASPDDTAEVMARYVEAHPQVRYFRQSENGGVDGDYDNAVGYARGDYCWLMPDDDLMLPGAVVRVLEEIASGVDLVVVNAEVHTVDFSRKLSAGLLPAEGPSAYEDAELLFRDTGRYLSFIGGVVVRREFWLSRERTRHYGTLFIHVGTLFQAPPVRLARVIREPLLAIRFGNAMWTARGFEIWMKKWPRLVWSFEHFSAAARKSVSSAEPFREVRQLVLYRALGGYSLEVFRSGLTDDLKGRERWLARLVAASPSSLMNAICTSYCLLKPQQTRMGLYNLAQSASATWLTRQVAQLCDLPISGSSRPRT